MATAALSKQLDLYGPDSSGAVPPSLAEAQAYCRNLAKRHYENFAVASWLLPGELKPHFYAVYAWCRWADDLADETADSGESLRLLDWWEQELARCYSGQAVHPVYIALSETLRKFEIPTAPLTDLLTAFRQDQRVRSYETFDDLHDYCKKSANPVGRLVLYLGRCYREELATYCDSVCTGLQLANFWQDVAEDMDRGRVYLPREDREQVGYDDQMLERRETNQRFLELMQLETDRAEQFLRAGLPLVQLVPKPLRLDVSLFIHGGLCILRRIRQIDYRVWSVRPKLRRRDGLRVAAASLREAYLPAALRARRLPQDR